MLNQTENEGFCMGEDELEKLNVLPKNLNLEEGRTQIYTQILRLYSAGFPPHKA